MLSVLKKIFRPWFYRIIKRASKSYIAGDTRVDAQRTSRYLESRGYTTTLAYWDSDDDESEKVISEYRKSIDLISSEGQGGYLSIKAPAFGFRKDLFKDLAEFAREKRVPLHLDSLAYASSKNMFVLIKNTTTVSLAGIGCSLPGRWRRSLGDADLAVELGLTARVVKGQWPDPNDPQKNMTIGFLDVVKQLAGRAPLVRIATHDPELVKESIGILHSADTSCELELLYGLPMGAVLPVAQELNVPVRIYVPYGYAWVPYCLDQIKNQPRMLWWLLKDSLTGMHLKTMPRCTTRERQ